MPSHQPIPQPKTNKATIQKSRIAEELGSLSQDDDRRTLSPRAIMQLQRSIGNRAVHQMLSQSIANPIQMRPADMNGLVTQDIDASWTEFGTWNSLVKAVKAYALLDDTDFVKRDAALTSLTQLSDAWMTQFLEAKTKNSFDGKATPPQEILRSRMVADRLSPLIEREKAEILLTRGSLVGADDVAVSANPQITKQIKDDKDKSMPGGIFKSDADIINSESAKIGEAHKGTACIIIVDWDDMGQIKRDTHYKVTKEDEAIAGDNYQDIPSGFVRKDQLLSVNRTEKRTDLKYADRKDPLKYPLFVHPPKKEDVVQVGLGDCYLLAGILSILNTNAGHFTSHMLDDGAGNVTVKLYKDVNDPVFVKVEKSVVVNSIGADAFAAGALWVKILEKAYVAAGFFGTENDALPVKEKGYGMTEGGFGNVVFKHLLGVDTEQEEIGRVNPMVDKGVWMTQIRESLKAEYQQDPSNNILLNKVIEMEQLGAAIMREYSDNDDVRMDDLKRIMSEQRLTEESPLWTSVMSVVARENHELMSGALGGGKYTAREISLFQKVKDKLDAGQFITASTKEKVIDHKDGDKIEKGRSSNENMGKGLVGTHAYSILDYAPKAPVAGNVLSVKLRNPWAAYGRKYVNDRGESIDVTTGEAWVGKAVEDREAAEFWVDISELFIRFNTMDFT